MMAKVPDPKAGIDFGIIRYTYKELEKPVHFFEKV
jgi:hypothetical protein